MQAEAACSADTNYNGFMGRCKAYSIIINFHKVYPEKLRNTIEKYACPCYSNTIGLSI